DRTKPCFHMRFGPSSCCLRRSGGRLLVWRCLMLNTQSEASVSAQGMTERHERFGSDDYVVFKNVQKTYDGEHLIVKDLNLSVRRGEFLTMLGPSGSGKTTTLMMLAGFETATGGEIYLDTR